MKDVRKKIREILESEVTHDVSKEIKMSEKFITNVLIPLVHNVIKVMDNLIVLLRRYERDL